MTADELRHGVVFGPGGHLWANFETAAGLRATSGLVLHLQHRLGSTAALGGATVELRASVTLDQSTGWLRLGMAHAVAPVILPPSDAGYRDALCTLEIGIDQVELEAIEASRRDDALRLRLELAALVLVHGGLVLSGIDHTEVSLNAEEWGRLLDQAQTHRQLTMLVQTPDRDMPQARHRADEFLRKARVALRQGRYDDACVAARRGIDALAVKDAEAARMSARQRTMDQRYGALAQALFDLTSPGAHGDGEAVDHEWDRSDAITAISGLMSLLARVQSEGE